MNQPMIKALICDDSAPHGVKIAAELTKNQIYAYTRSANAPSIISSILSDKPDVVILDLTLENTDAAAIMQKVFPLVSKSPAFIVLSEIDNNFIKKQILSLGASYFLVKPIDISRLADIVRSVADTVPDKNCQNANLLTTELIRKAGIPAHIKGYRYVRACIIECLSDKTMLDSITKRLYSKVAEKYETTPIRVERAIRHAIEIAWDRGNVDTLNSFFGYTVDTSKGKPTNSEFIALITDKLRLRYKSALRRA